MLATEAKCEAPSARLSALHARDGKGIIFRARDGTKTENSKPKCCRESEMHLCAQVLLGLYEDRTDMR